MFRPVVIWNLDDETRPYVEQWHGRTDAVCRRFVRRADSWEDVRDAFREYNTVSVAEELRALGVGQDGDGTRVIVILVAYGMGEDSAFRDWADVEDKLDRMQREITHVERQRILIARPSQHQIRDRIVGCSGAREVPWLLSDRTSRMQQLDDTGFQELFSRLVDALCFVPRDYSLNEAEPSDAFFLSHPGQDSVRLVGVPEIQLDRLVETVANDCAVAVAITLMENVRDEHDVGKHLADESKQQLEKIAVNQLSIDAYEKQLHGKRGLRGLEAAELLEHGERVILRVVARIDAVIASWDSRVVPADRSKRSGCLPKRVARWLFGSRSQQPPSRGLDRLTKQALEAQVCPVRDRLTVLADELKCLKDEFYRHRRSPLAPVPDNVRKEFRSTLKTLLHECLSKRAHGGPAEYLLADVFNQYLAESRDYFDREQINELIGGFWAVSHPDSRKLQLMDRGEFYTFSAAATGGNEIPSGSGIVRNDGPKLDRSKFGRVEYFPGVRSEMLLCSRSIPVKQLRW